MYQIFFTHSSVDEQLGCFHVLAIVNSGAVNIEVHISFQITVFSRFMGASFVVQLVKNLPAMQETGFNPWVGKIPWRRERLSTPVFWPGEFHGLYSPWGCKE